LIYDIYSSFLIHLIDLYNAIKMLTEFRKLADWLIFGSEVEDGEGFTEAGVSGNKSSTDQEHTRRVLSREQTSVLKTIHDSGGGLIDLQCGKRVFNDVPAKMRTELWLSQLHSLSEAIGTTGETAYNVNLKKYVKEDVLTEIGKDIHRTFPGHKTLSTRSGQRAMFDVLRAYASFDPDVGYSQGMNFLSGILLTYLSPPQAFDALVLIMKDRGLREYYRPNGMVHLQARLWQLGKLIPPELEEQLETHMVLPVLYASSWLLTCFASEFPIKFAARVMDVIITNSYHLPIMKVSIAILERCKNEILQLNNMEDIIHLIRNEVPKWPENILQDLLTASLSTSWSDNQLEWLGNSAGETVADMLQRVQNSAIPLPGERPANFVPTEISQGSQIWTSPEGRDHLLVTDQEDSVFENSGGSFIHSNPESTPISSGESPRKESLLDTDSELPLFSPPYLQPDLLKGNPAPNTQGDLIDFYSTMQSSPSEVKTILEACIANEQCSSKVCDVLLSQSMNYSSNPESANSLPLEKADFVSTGELRLSDNTSDVGDAEFGDWQSG
jgi:hypothetical protein